MATSAFSGFNEFVQDIGSEQHNLGSDTLKIALTDTLPTATDANWNLTSHPAPTNTNGYTAGGNTLTGVSYTETGGTATLDFADTVYTATAGGIGPFRYAVLYNSSSASPTNAGIGWYDYGSSISLGDGETLTISTTTNCLTIS